MHHTAVSVLTEETTHTEEQQESVSSVVMHCVDYTSKKEAFVAGER
jgi:hypothetical protein